MAEEKPEEIRQQIEDTSNDLKNKVEMLEEQVLGTVKGTTEAVGDTVDKVKETVDTTVEMVKDTVTDTIASVKESVHSTIKSVTRLFDVQYQTRRHPWSMFSVSVVAGFAAGRLLGPRAEAVRHAPSNGNGYRAPARSQPAPAAPPPESGPSHSEGLLSRLFEHFEGEVRTVKAMALGTLMDKVRDLAKNALPSNLAPKVDQVIDSLTTKLGGEVIHDSGREAETAGVRY